MDENKSVVLVSEYDTVFDKEKVFEKLPEKFRNDTVFMAITNALGIEYFGENEQKINHESKNNKISVERMRLEIVGDEIRAMHKMKLRDEVNPYGYESDSPYCAVTTIKYDNDGNLVINDNRLNLTLKYPGTKYVIDKYTGESRVNHIPAVVVKKTRVYDKSLIEIANVEFKTLENRINPRGWYNYANPIFNNFEAYLNAAVKKTEIVDETMEKNKYNFDFRNTYSNLLRNIPNHVDPCFLCVKTRNTKDDKVTAVMNFVNSNGQEKHAYIEDIVVHKEGDRTGKGLRIDEVDSDKNREYMEKWREINSAYYEGVESEKKLNFRYGDDMYLEENLGSTGRSR